MGDPRFICTEHGAKFAEFGVCLKCAAGYKDRALAAERKLAVTVKALRRIRYDDDGVLNCQIIAANALDKCS